MPWTHLLSKYGVIPALPAGTQGLFDGHQRVASERFRHDEGPKHYDCCTYLLTPSQARGDKTLSF